jgi:hypothetical protein
MNTYDLCSLGGSSFRAYLPGLIRLQQVSHQQNKSSSTITVARLNTDHILPVAKKLRWVKFLGFFPVR